MVKNDKGEPIKISPLDMGKKIDNIFKEWLHIILICSSPRFYNAEIWHGRSKKSERNWGSNKPWCESSRVLHKRIVRKE